MKTVIVGHKPKREIEIPETWREGEEMLLSAMRYHDGRGNNANKLSAAARVAYGMFGEQFMAADPTQALVYLMAKICATEGAGLK